MEVIKSIVAGVDVHKEVLAITVLKGETDSQLEVQHFTAKTFTEDLIAAGQILLEKGVKEVAMESTGVYWKPIYNVWEPMGINITLAQAAHVKNVPGRKTDMNDSRWLAQLHRFGLIRASFIPPQKFQQIRLFSRHRTNLVNDLATIKNRIQKTLEDGNIKLSSVVSDVFGKAGVAVLRLLAKSVIDPQKLTNAVTTRVKRKGEIRKSLTNCFTLEHCFLINELMTQYDHYLEKIRITENKLFDLTKDYSHLIEELKKIPGISDVIAIGIIAESTDDMTNFDNPRRYAAWAGVAAGNNESAGKKKVKM